VIKKLGYSSVKHQQMMVIKEFINRRDIFVILPWVLPTAFNCIPINNCLGDYCIPQTLPRLAMPDYHKTELLMAFPPPLVELYTFIIVVRQTRIIDACVKDLVWHHRPFYKRL